MKVAFTTSDGEMIDRHFGQCSTFYLWEITKDKADFTGKLETVENGVDEEDRIAARADILSGCVIVYTMQIGGPAAAKLVARRVYPMKTNTIVPIRETIQKLQEVLNGNPPPWLRKAMNNVKTILND